MTDEELGYRRINAGVCLFFNYFKIDKGVQVWNPHFIEHVNDCNALFNDLYFDKINNAIGETGWAINFVQFSQESATWLVDIYLDNPEHYYLIVQILKSNTPQDMIFNFYPRGNLFTYTQSQ